MFIKILLLASTVSLIYGQTVDDCNQQYKACYQDAWQRQVKERYQPQRSQQQVHRRPAPTPRPSNDAATNGDDENEVGGSCLEAHNKLRALHGVPPLKAPSAELQAYADKRGLELASTDNFSHPANSKYGENLFMGYGKVYTCEDGVQAWYDEIKDYNFGKPGFSSGTGHFTQVVWKDAKEVACSTTKSKKTGYTYVVCNYAPHGNVMGRFKENVLPKKA